MLKLTADLLSPIYMSTFFLQAENYFYSTSASACTILCKKQVRTKINKATIPLKALELS